MLWIYDNAIADDLASCIDPSGGANSNVKVMDPGMMQGVLAQIQEDRISFPAICLFRTNVSLDNQRYNFSLQKKGVPACYYSDKNEVYIERVMPIKMKYVLCILATNTVDRDEILREIMFRYNSTYFLTAQIPYESKRKVRFGISIAPDTDIDSESASLEYVQSGTLYQSRIELVVEGAVQVDYTSRHGISMESEIVAKTGIQNLK